MKHDKVGSVTTTEVVRAEYGTPVGIVTRRDLLRVVLRPDGEIRDEVIADVLGRTLCCRPAASTYPLCV